MDTLHLMDLLNQVKQVLINHLKRKGDTVIFKTRCNNSISYTGNMLAEEVENETEEGVKLLCNIMTVSLMQIERETNNDS